MSEIENGRELDTLGKGGDADKNRLLVDDNTTTVAKPSADVKENEVKNSLTGGKTSNTAPNPAEDLEVDSCYGWVVVVASFFSCYVVGLMFIAFSIFYNELSSYFQASKGSVGLIGSLYLATGNLCGIVLGVGVQYFGCRIIILAGSLVWTLSLILSSLANSVIILYFTYGILGGFGFNMIVIASFVIVQKHFKKYRSLAAGLSAAGISIGSITSGPLTGFLIEYYGWRGAMVILSGLTLNCCVFGSFYREPKVKGIKVVTIAREEENEIKLEDGMNQEVTKTTPPPAPAPAPQKKPLSAMLKKLCKDLTDLSLFYNKQLVIALISSFLFNVGTSMFYQHTPNRALSFGLDKKLAYLIQSAIGGVTLAGRILGAIIGNFKCTDRVFEFGFSILFGGLCIVLTAPFQSFIGICIIASCTGFCAGVTMTIQSTVMTDIVGVGLIHKAQSFVFVFMGAGAFVGVPTAGLIYDRTKNYNVPFYVFGSCQIFGGLLLVIAHFIKIKSKTRGVVDQQPPPTV